MSSKKDYEAIASIIKIHVDRGDINDHDLLHALATDLIIHFGGENKKFDSLRFMLACGLIP